MLAEQDRNLQQQLGDIQSRGDQASFAQAQQAFEADRAARLQASQMGLQQGVASDSSSQEAERLRQSAFGTTEQALGQTPSPKSAQSVPVAALSGTTSPDQWSFRWKVLRSLELGDSIIQNGILA